MAQQLFFNNSTEIHRMSRYLCILDFEANCAETKEEMSRLHMDNEVIEFPSVLVEVLSDGTTKKISEFQVYVKPRNTPILTNFCTELTKITQDKVDAGVTFPVALKMHEDWLKANIPDYYKMVGDDKVLIITCGRWDLSVMAPKEYVNWNIKPSKIYARFVNIKDDFEKFYHTKSHSMMNQLNFLQLTHEGTHHSGIDDCKNISNIAIRMINDGLAFENFHVSKIK